MNPVTKRLDISLPPRESFSFYSPTIPALLGFDSKLIGKKEHVVKEPDETEEKITYRGTYPVDMQAGVSIMFVYINIIEYQVIGNMRAPLLRAIPMVNRMRNDSLAYTQTLNYNSFGSDLQYKNLMSNAFQTVKVELRDDSGKLVPFMGNGRTVLTLSFKRKSV